MNTALQTALLDFTKSLKGGEGSGFHGHAGRPGEVGGSTARGESTPPKDISQTFLVGQRIAEQAPYVGLDTYVKGGWDQAGKKLVQDRVRFKGLRPQLGWTKDQIDDIKDRTTSILARMPKEGFGHPTVIFNFADKPENVAGRALIDKEEMIIFMRQCPTPEDMTAALIHEYGHLQDKPPETASVPFHVAFKDLVDERISLANKMYDYSKTEAEREAAREQFKVVSAKEDAVYRDWALANSEPSEAMSRYLSSFSSEGGVMPTPEFVSGYASNTASDRFAEAFAMYVSPYGREVMAKHYPKTFEFMDKFFKEKRKAK